MKRWTRAIHHADSTAAIMDLLAEQPLDNNHMVSTAWQKSPANSEIGHVLEAARDAGFIGQRNPDKCVPSPLFPPKLEALPGCKRRADEQRSTCLRRGTGRLL
ncbi:hypothetical protein [Teichococcus vastitatis]|uniref:Uncharacterized protein n=1 Tax=Teichococcus vastitatis TaxID=2307076 RepID=A0ABS9W8U2_9PROT|nr:hypothetical protein [Pseudoroseomonas vastitatis]MCI0755034.1 hypothetical protein [Pseudoroseomonas vastitatis]